MSRVLAFDFGASTGRAILAEYNGEKIEYNEIHRFDNVLCEQNGMLCWDFDYLLGEVKRQFLLRKMQTLLRLIHGALITECSTRTAILFQSLFAIAMTEQRA